MKKLRLSFLAIGAFLLFTTTVVNAQDQMYWIHVDHVKPAMQKQYEKTAKEFADACKNYNIPDFTFNVWRHDDGAYYYSSPMKNFAEMDKDGLKPLRDKMGADKFKTMFDGFDKCYDNHHSFMVTHKSELSYMPEGKLNDGDFREYYYMYVTPENSNAVAEKLKEIKDLWTKKGAKHYYSILHTGFGANEEFYVAIVAAKDDLESAQNGMTNNKLLGEEWGKKWNEVYSLLSRLKIETSMYREDLSYNQKK